MIWLIIGGLGMGVFLAALVLAPVWVGAMSLKESLLIIACALALAGIMFLLSWALAHGIGEGSQP